jgi:hypothetical protein
MNLCIATSLTIYLAQAPIRPSPALSTILSQLAAAIHRSPPLRSAIADSLCPPIIGRDAHRSELPSHDSPKWP